MNTIGDGTGGMMEERRRGHKYSDDGSGRDVDHQMMDVDGESGTTGIDTSKASLRGVTSGVRTEDDLQLDNDICPSWVMGEGSRRLIVILSRLHYRSHFMNQLNGMDIESDLLQ